MQTATATPSHDPTRAVTAVLRFSEKRRPWDGVSEATSSPDVSERPTDSGPAFDHMIPRFHVDGATGG
ncbi:hypothetical protein GCM10023114_51900 [Mycolicibacterium sediminis]|uniref:Uncharacterized protein n=1 Tax=Mycolicibacterium sediminis TaxID=1286180 RepID=A0A7I7QME2_9MYCO|nr:hypothetical protein MSEDJ_11520 [Mycolicibacterium sediminis]